MSDWFASLDAWKTTPPADYDRPDPLEGDPDFRRLSAREDHFRARAEALSKEVIGEAEPTRRRRLERLYELARWKAIEAKRALDDAIDEAVEG
jgi:hypothetical protein